MTEPSWSNIDKLTVDVKSVMSQCHRQLFFIFNSRLQLTRKNKTLQARVTRDDVNCALHFLVNKLR